jgi:hypothetical protein
VNSAKLYSTENYMVQASSTLLFATSGRIAIFTESSLKSMEFSFRF